ncbi:hypothetical protein PybrP1_009016 [[Pythium] brassicae (nom. inval.)]|nr:hypothetical protein PybrP1_009016 [[Pythium] brassicae (nom. inval.)]
MLRWLHAESLFTRGGVGWSDYAASADHLHILQWIHENLSGDGCGKRAMLEAARHGHLEVVRWLHDVNQAAGCPSLAMVLAAANERPPRGGAVAPREPGRRMHGASYRQSR